MRSHDAAGRALTTSDVTLTGDDCRGARGEETTLDKLPPFDPGKTLASRHGYGPAGGRDGMPYSPQALTPEERVAQDANVIASCRARAVKAIRGCPGLDEVASAVESTRSHEVLLAARLDLREHRARRIATGEPLASVNVALSALGALWAALP